MPPVRDQQFQLRQSIMPQGQYHAKTEYQTLRMVIYHAKTEYSTLRMVIYHAKTEYSTLRMVPRKDRVLCPTDGTTQRQSRVYPTADGTLNISDVGQPQSGPTCSLFSQCRVHASSQSRKPRGAQGPFPLPTVSSSHIHTVYLFIYQLPRSHVQCVHQVLGLQAPERVIIRFQALCNFNAK